MDLATTTAAELFMEMDHHEKEFMSTLESFENGQSACVKNTAQFY